MIERLLSDGEAAHLLGMIPSRLLRLSKQRAVPHIVLPDGEIRFRMSDLNTWIQHHAVEERRNEP